MGSVECSVQMFLFFLHNHVICYVTYSCVAVICYVTYSCSVVGIHFVGLGLRELVLFYFNYLLLLWVCYVVDVVAFVCLLVVFVLFSFLWCVFVFWSAFIIFKKRRSFVLFCFCGV